jgi:hypothetical protein
MNEKYYNQDGDVPAPKGGGKIGGGDVSAIIEGVGKVVVGGIDASKRRKMDFAFNQQKLQAELGFQEKSLAQQFKLAQLNLLAKAGSGISEDPKKATTIVWVVAGTLALGLAGFVTYVILKNK